MSGSVLQQVEDVFARTLNQLSQDDLSLSFPSADTTFSFPGNPSDAWRFTVIITILEIIRDALRSGRQVTKRDIYYRDPELFGSQNAVDRHIELIANSLAVPRHSLNVVAAAKGLVTGALKIVRRQGSVDVSEPCLIPDASEILSIDSHASWVLVVEKEAAFQSVYSSAFWGANRSHGILITGKGYPDGATRELVHRLSTTLPVYGLVDYDPDGLAIFSVYKDGSKALEARRHELAADMQWIGLNKEELMLSEVRGLLGLTARDRLKARQMLRGSDCWTHELQRMLMLNVKAELEILDEVDGLSSLLEEKLSM